MVIETRFDIGQQAWVLKRGIISVPSPCKPPYHSGDACRNCQGTGTRYTDSAIGALRPASEVVTFIGVDHAGIRYYVGGGFGNGTEITECCFATEADAQAECARRNQGGE